MKKIPALILGFAIWLHSPAQSCLPEGIILASQEQVDLFRQNYPGCEIIEGNVQICGEDISNLDSLLGIKSINGNLTIGYYCNHGNVNLHSLAGLDSLHFVGGEVLIRGLYSLSSLHGLEGLHAVGDNLYILDCLVLTNLTGLSGLTSIGTDLEIIGNYSLDNLDGLQGIQMIPGNVYIIDNDLINLYGLNGLIQIGGEIDLAGNDELLNLVGLESLENANSIWIHFNDNLSSLDGINNLTTVGGWLNIEDNAELDSITALENLQFAGNLSISNNEDLINLKGLEGLDSVGFLGILSNENMVSLTGLEGLTSVGEKLAIGSNMKLPNLEGLQNIISVNGDLSITANEILSSLSGLEELQSINGKLIINSNSALTTLSGLDNIDAGSISSIEIKNNGSLSDCAVQSICNYLASPNGTVAIYANAPDCNNPAEIANICGFTMPCLPFGNYYFFSQADIDNFQSLYPNCTVLEGFTGISGPDIINLLGLSNVTSFGQTLYIHENELLTSLSGLEEVTYIGNSLDIWNNDSLSNITSLEGVTYIGHSLEIGVNYLLETLAGLDNFATDSTFGLYIYNNYSLSTCAIESICNILSDPGGSYYIANNAPGCEYQQEVESQCGVGESEINIPENLFRIYPNPTQGQITIEIDETNYFTSASIFDHNCHELKRFKLISRYNNLDISDLPNGMYFIKCLSDKHIEINKVIKFAY